MFREGEYVIYSAHGVCRIEDICDKTFWDETRTYYVLRPLDDPELTISLPADPQPDAILKIMERDDAEKLIHSFQQPGVDWVENNNQRAQKYQQIVNAGNREGISKVVNTLMKKKLEAEQNNKKLAQSDLRLLTSIQHILFSELAISLGTSVEAVEERVTRMIQMQKPSAYEAAP